MFRVVLIDDEAWSLESISNLVDWNSLGYAVDRTFTDPEAALEYLVAHPADLVFTDIRMPVLSGLQVMQKTREAGVTDTSFVVVSGYGEFAYAQDAIRLGAGGYCLKPVDREELEELLVRLEPALEENRILRDADFYARLPEEADRGAAYRQAAVLLGGCDGRARARLEAGLRTRGRLLHLGPDKMILLAGADGPGEEELEELLEAAGASCRVGFGRELEAAGDLAASLQEAEIAARRHFLYPDAPWRNRFVQRSFLPVRRCVQELGALLTQRQWEKTVEAVDRIPGYLRENGMEMQHLLFLYNEIISLLVHQLDHNLPHLNYLDIEQLAEGFATIDDLCEFVKNVILNASQYEKTGGSQPSFDFRRLVRYLHAHYNEPLSLRQLAKDHFISFNYCCYLFKKHTDMTFHEYLLKIRMERAHELLSRGQHPVFQVSGLVGYHDQYYFCKRFKKYFGFLPSELPKMELVAEAGNGEKAI